jgi:hypothetical protein
VLAGEFNDGYSCVHLWRGYLFSMFFPVLSNEENSLQANFIIFVGHSLPILGTLAD